MLYRYLLPRLIRYICGYAGITLLATVLGMIPASTAAVNAADWPNWRGPSANGISSEKNLNLTSPKVLWKASVGKGFSTFAVAKGKVYTIGNTNDTDTVYCLNAKTGKLIWKYSYPCPLDPKAFEGGPLSTPTVDGDYVFTLSKFGHCFCFNASTGAIVWQRKFDIPSAGKGDYQVWWGFSGSIVAAGDRLILPIGTGATAVNKRNGKTIWDNGPGYPGYSTPVLFKKGNTLCFAMLSGHEAVAAQVEDGKMLWRIPWKTTWDMNASDIIIAKDRMFISTGHGVGCAIYDISGNSPVELWRNKNMRTYYSTCVLWKGYLYGFDDNQLRCIDWKTGEIKWTVPETGPGTLMLADGELIALNEKGNLLFARATEQSYQPIGLMQILSGRCWSVPVLADGRLYIRNANGDAVCLNVQPAVAKKK